MLGVGHALSGWCAGMTISLGVQAPLPLALTVAGASTGAAMVPDWDHHGSTVTTAFGPASHAVHRGVVILHKATARVLRVPGDPSKPPGAHRGITHWWPFPLVLGGIVAALCALVPWASVAVLAVLFTLAVRGLSVPEYRDDGRGSRGRRWSRRTAHRLAGAVPTIFVLKMLRRRVSKLGKPGLVVLATGVAYFAVAHGSAGKVGPWLGMLVAVGCVVHVLGDAPTESGVPGLRLWTEWRLPKWIAFKAGGWFERLLVWAPLSIVGVLLIPGVWPVVADTAPQLVAQLGG